VNAAYDAGITIVTASGNNFHGVPTQHVIYPARFERVIAACGVTYDFKPYHHSKITEMQGCYGPERHMDKALSAFTPNTPWAAGDKKRIMFSGAGTSSATPQVAATAAIYYKKYNKELDSLQPWQRVEAIRYALFKSASQKGNAPGSYKNYFGNGIIQAKDALKIPVNSSLPKTAEDSMPWFPILTTIFKGKPGGGGNKMNMFNTELAQLVYHNPELAAIIDNEEEDFDQVSKRKWATFTDAVIEHPDTSITLKKFLIATHQPSN
jgi:subtilisin family serine protease